MSESTVYIGIDVAKTQLEVSVPGKKTTSVANTRRGIQALLAKLHRLEQPIRLCCEATGGYEKLLISMALANQM